MIEPRGIVEYRQDIGNQRHPPRTLQPKSSKRRSPLRPVGRDPRKLRAWLAAMVRFRDGQPAEECFTEMFLEMGYTADVARQKVQKAEKAFADGDDGWRESLI